MEDSRLIIRSIHQDLLDELRVENEPNKSEYRSRVIVEHPYGTAKRGWGAYFLLTRGKASVAAEAYLVFLAYNFRRATNILGVPTLIDYIKGMGRLAPN
jgi:hypothetical protein